MKGCYKLSLTQNWVPMGAFLRKIFFFFHIINLLLIIHMLIFLPFDGNIIISCDFPHSLCDENAWTIFYMTHK